MVDKNICPVCKSEDSVNFSVSSSDGSVSLVAGGYGKIWYLCGCLSCGSIFLPEDQRLEMSRYRIKRGG